jgi:hypothetical protein
MWSLMRASHSSGMSPGEQLLDQLLGDGVLVEGIEVDERALARHPFGGTKPFVLLPVHEDGSIASP